VWIQAVSWREGIGEGVSMIPVRSCLPSILALRGGHDVSVAHQSYSVGSGNPLNIPSMSMGDMSMRSTWSEPSSFKPLERGIPSKSGSIWFHRGCFEPLEDELREDMHDHATEEGGASPEKHVISKADPERDVLVPEHHVLVEDAISALKDPGQKVSAQACAEVS
jgi:hypothetical protein